MMNFKFLKETQDQGVPFHLSTVRPFFWKTFSCFESTVFQSVILSQHFPLSLLMLGNAHWSLGRPASALSKCLKSFISVTATAENLVLPSPGNDI
jgi:hypothetical protein